MRSLFLLVAVVIFLIYSMSKWLVVSKGHLLIYLISNGCPRIVIVSTDIRCVEGRNGLT